MTAAPNIWLRLRWQLWLWTVLFATTFTPSAIFADDGQHQTTVAYDSNGEFAVGYDAVFGLAQGEMRNGTLGSGVPYVKLAEFLAAEEAASVFLKGYQGGPGAMWANEGRGLWQLTTEGADRVMTHGNFGTFYRSASDGLWWAEDMAGHGGSAFKVFRETGTGLQWFRDADQFGDFIVGKHKGPIGQFIPWKELRGR